MERLEINIKNLKPLIFIGIVLVLTAISAYPQRNLSGKVVEIIDGKTCVIQMPTNKLTVVLQFIEIPEPEQPLYKTVKEHLQTLILDKTVEIFPRGVMNDRTVGQLWVRGVDVSQQMIRDGAAWYSIYEKDSHKETERLLYQDNEAQAKAEKRGVWGVETLKPSWEFRAEKRDLKEQREKEAKLNRAFVSGMREQSKSQPQRQQVVPQTEMWADVGDGGTTFDQPLGIGGLRGGYDSTRKIGHVSTDSITLDIAGNDFTRNVESRVFYFYRGDKTNIETSVYAIGFLSTSKEYKFLKSNSLILTADKEKIALGKARRVFRQGTSGVQELLVYKMTRAQLMKLAKAERISLQLGKYSAGISKDSLDYINNLLKAS